MHTVDVEMYDVFGSRRSCEVRLGLKVWILESEHELEETEMQTLVQAGFELVAWLFEFEA